MRTTIFKKGGIRRIFIKKFGVYDIKMEESGRNALLLRHGNLLNFKTILSDCFITIRFLFDCNLRGCEGVSFTE
jgi:hypothetical protein